MKTLKWNIGIFIIRIGYIIRGHDGIYPPYNRRELIGREILRFGYWLRGEIPMKTWRGNHI